MHRLETRSGTTRMERVHSRLLLPWLALLPAAILAWPIPPTLLEDDPFPHLAGAGIVALAAVPLALLLPFGKAGARVRGWLPLALVWIWIGARILFGDLSDSFEARRAFVQASSWLVLFFGGALLAEQGERGRRTFLRGLVVLSIALTAGAFARFNEGHLAGVLGNTGTLSQAALPGAVAGAWFAAAESGVFVVLGLVSALLFAAHAGLAPVYAGGAAFVLIVACCSILARRARENARARARLLVLAALAGLALVGLRPIEFGKTGEAETAASTASADVGGLAVRLQIWSTLPAILAAHPVAGLGPGQFHAEYPPFRDPAEAVLSRHGPCSRVDTEVEHMHQDLMQAFAELGLVGGGLFAVFLVLVAFASLRALVGTDPSRGVAGAAALALLANGLLHAPLLANPLASALGFTLFGMLFREERPELAGGATRVLLGAVSIIGLAGAGLAWPLVAHGRGLIDYVHAAERLVALDEKPKTTPLPPLLGGELLSAAEDAERAIARAKEAAPRSAPARTLVARNADDAAWNAVLEVRPHSLEAWESIGLRQARAHQVDAARAAWERALALSASQPRILENLARLEFLDGDPTRGFQHLETLRESGCLAPRWMQGFGSELVLGGRMEAGARLLLERELAELVPEELYARASDADPLEIPHRAEALRALAHLLWARAQVAAGDYATAVRSYRQTLAQSRVAVEGGAPVLRAELAAAELLAGRRDDAARTLEGIGEGLGGRSELPGLPAWAAEALEQQGLLPDGRRP